MRGVFLVVGAALAFGLLAVADDGSVAWPCVRAGWFDCLGPQVGGCALTTQFPGCPAPEIKCDPCVGRYMRCCYYVWYPRGFFYTWCEPHALYCWPNPCEGPIPAGLEAEPL